MNDTPGRLTWRATRRLIGRDMDAYGAWPLAFRAWRAGRPRWLFFLWLCATQHMFPSTVLFRLQCYLFERGLPWAATVISRLNHTVCGVTIGNHVRAGGGLYLAHGHVVMDGAVQLGEGVEIAPFVTLGLVNSASKAFTLQGPVIGDAVNIGTGAKVLGPVRIGSHVKVGANAVVIDDVPAWHTAIGVPAISRLRADAPVTPVADPGREEAAG